MKSISYTGDMNEISTFEKNHPVLVEYLRSSAITFLSVFLSVLATNINSLSSAPAASITISFVAGVVLTAVRAAGKAVIESITNKQYPSSQQP